MKKSIIVRPFIAHGHCHAGGLRAKANGSSTCTEAPAATTKLLSCYCCPRGYEAPAEAAPAFFPKITVAVQGDPSNLGPFVGMSMGRIGVLTTMYEYLFYQIGPELTPYIAKSFEKVDDNNL